MDEAVSGTSFHENQVKAPGFASAGERMKQTSKHFML